MEIKKLIKKKFYSSKEAILLDSVDLSKIVVLSIWKLNDTTYKYFCGYLNNDVIKPLGVILPQMNGYIKYFDNGGKNISFVTDDKEVYEKYDEIWNVVKSLLKLTKRTDADKILKNKAFDIAKDSKYYGYQRGLASMVSKFFDSKVASPDKKLKKVVQNLYLNMSNYLKNSINLLLENLKKEKYIQHLKIIFGVLI